MEQIEFYSETEMSVYIVAFKTNEKFMYIFLQQTSEGNRQRLYKWGKKQTYMLYARNIRKMVKRHRNTTRQRFWNISKPAKK